jgi:AraC-like DNA-binding protein
MVEINEFIRLLSLGLALAIAVQYAKLLSRLPNSAAGLGLCICLCCYLILPISFESWGVDWLGSVWLEIFLLNATYAIPALLWLHTRLQLSDDRKVPTAFWWLTFAYIFPSMVEDILYLSDIATTPVSNSFLDILLFDIVARAIPIGMIIHVIYMCVSDLGDDLLEPRRLLRKLYSVLISGYFLVAIIARFWFAYESPLWLQLAESSALFIGLFLLHAYSFSYSFQPIEVSTPRRRKNPGRPVVIQEDEDTRKIVALLKDVMENNMFYTRPGATIQSLAAELKLPEYRVRRVINGELGFNNFNQYLNSLRIERSLILLRETDTPIVNIALDLGYKSLSPFNRAFRQSQNTTPTEFRNRYSND